MSSVPTPIPSGSPPVRRPGAPFDLPQLCRDVATLLRLDDPRELETGVQVGGERLCLLYDEDLDDGVYMFIDVGPLPGGGDAEAVLRVLMDVNLEIPAEQGASFGLDATSGRIVFRAFMRDTEFTPEMIAREMLLHVDMVGELRRGPLAM